MKRLLFIILLLSFWSCKTNKPLVTGTTTKVIIEKQMDTVLFSRPDSATILALIKCDSAGNAYLSQILELELGKSVKPEIIVKENTIRLNCIVDSMAVYARMYKRFESKKDTTSTVITIYRDKPKSAARKFLNGMLLIFIGASLTVAGFIYYKRRWE